MIEIVRLSGEGIRPYLTEVAKLRIEVFREFPYLYDGSEDYEREYLDVYTKSGRSVIVLALRDGQVIGASTGLPLVDADEAFQKPFRDTGMDVSRVFYFGESVLRQSERGQGIGHRFFDERESHAREHGFSMTTFCAVQRDPEHPMRPENYRENDTFWKKRGYKRTSELAAELNWEQIDQPGTESCNRLIFWLKRDF
ncbi:MAG TPA: GNAT family N-acetyltransferase [Chthoniobacteraceae bacterium]|nr:GNAT family N-acetyltransferase [Chthoniobacteraceae bacterium]